MAPIRRYLRITKYSVLEVRIYLQKPSDVSWLLSSRDNALERIIQEVRPKVLPKLREENENAKKKGKAKKRGIKDVASQDDFEVSIFLKETSTRHSLLTKSKQFAEKPRMKSTGNKLTGWLSKGEERENAIHIEDDERPPEILREEEEEEDVFELKDVPEVAKSQKRKSTASQNQDEDDDDDDGLFVSSSDEEFFATQRVNTQKRRKRNTSTDLQEQADEDTEAQDDKKKLLLDTSFDGFSIYGRILCLIVTRKGRRDEPIAPVGGSQMMEQWIGTQAVQEAGILDDDEG